MQYIAKILKESSKCSILSGNLFMCVILQALKRKVTICIDFPIKKMCNFKFNFNLDIFLCRQWQQTSGLGLDRT